MKEALLEVRNLTKFFPVSKGIFGKAREWLRAVHNVSFLLYSGETLGLVGESGCGKSTTRKLLLRLLEPDTGEVLLRDQGEWINIFQLPPKKLRELRKRMQVVFQDPYASLDPKWRVGDIISEPLRIHGIGTREQQREKVMELMELVGLRSEHYYRYPHEFSGGQRQRVGIARALALQPELIIADEPVSALDVSIQAQVINMFKDLQEKFGLTYIFIAHDLGVVKHICDRVGVMYLGKIVELAPTDELFSNPRHPYTKGLISSIPVPDPKSKRQLKLLEGEVPSPINPPEGCSFHPRCQNVRDICRKQDPPLLKLDSGHEVSCHLYTLNSNNQVSGGE